MSISSIKKFTCGCKVALDQYGKIDLDPDIEAINLQCPAVWNLISSGRVTGLFQIELQGKRYAKKLKPQNIEQLAALLAIIRPGATEAMRDNKSITDHYIDRKNGDEEITYYHSALEDILKPTLGELLYQENSMAIASKIAGFTLQESDMLRRCIGKKLPEEMAKVKIKFLKGCKKIKLVNDEEAEEIFSWIEKSQRYQLNKSHAISYAMNTYLTAYTKYHFTYPFFTSSLRHSITKPKPFDEIRALVNDARNFNISINTPNIKHLNSNFKLIDNQIYFGLINIKGVGQSAITKLCKYIKSVQDKFQKKTEDLTWLEFLLFIFPKLASTSVKAIIDAGALDHLKMSRKQMIYEYVKYNTICSSQKTREQKWIEDNYTNQWKTFYDCLIALSKAPIGKYGGCSSNRRLKVVQEIIRTVKDPPYNLSDSTVYIAEAEEAILGLPITCTSIESCDIKDANTTCLEFNTNIRHNMYMIACQIDRRHDITTKTNKKMCFLSVSDISGSIESIVVFPEQYNDYRPILYVKNNVMLVGERGKDRNSLIVKKIYQL
jgi:DNA polymerase-3 subunit alpha